MKYVLFFFTIVLILSSGSYKDRVQAFLADKDVSPQIIIVSENVYCDGQMALGCTSVYPLKIGSLGVNLTIMKIADDTHRKVCSFCISFDQTLIHEFNHVLQYSKEGVMYESEN